MNLIVDTELIHNTYTGRVATIPQEPCSPHLVEGKLVTLDTSTTAS